MSKCVNMADHFDDSNKSQKSELEKLSIEEIIEKILELGIPNDLILELKGHMNQLIFQGSIDEDKKNILLCVLKMILEQQSDSIDFSVSQKQFEKVFSDNRNETWRS